MNTPRSPREILLARHAATRPALDAQRDALLSRFAAEPAPSTSAEPASPRATASFSPLTTLRDVFGVLHRELFAPYRRAWSALTCVWLATLAFQQLDRFASQPLPAPSAATAGPDSESALLALWMEQRRQLAALADDTGSRATPSPAPAQETLSSPAASRPFGAIKFAPARRSVA